MIEKLFHLKENNTNIKTECLYDDGIYSCSQPEHFK